QARLGAEPAPAFDLAAACTGFLYGLGVADAMLRSAAARTLLLVGADALGAMVARDDRVCGPLFGDAAGAVVLRAEPGERGVLRVLLRARGAQAELLELPAGGPLDTGLAPRPAALCMRMKGPDLFRAAVTELLQVTRDLLNESGLGVVVGEQAAQVERLHHSEVKTVQRRTVGVARERPDLLFGHVDDGRRRPHDLVRGLAEQFLEAVDERSGGRPGEETSSGARLDLHEGLETGQSGDDGVPLCGDELHHAARFGPREQQP